MKLLHAAALAALIAGPAWAADEAPKNPLTESASWQDLQFDVLGDTQPGDAAGVFTVEAPYRAHDAATVPILIEQTDPSANILKATVVIDENPAPVAGVFTFGDAMAPLDFEMRLRVNQYSNVRVIAETESDTLMTGRFVKASGGCSAPASRDPEVALASMGQMKLKLFGDETAQMSTPRREAQIMIRHPNYSGLQRDQITQLFIAAHFIDTIEVYQGDEMLFTMEGGISISENPVFRFEYNDNGSTSLRVRATDTEGNVFERELPKSVQS
ncbi:quinoprotein dehydrogenase-associated SoxYZ-like carrier [Thalassococcus profundi]|uniref:Quinoprotein dehydrogenase-associated SoxYZ-like carrier n=1 Tax=Thalassococcus profundi TaxID=2282382 RepID=A0A369THJ6_9RHOB|nr:quinoprotein dehydrogenase-associated SoxYZ-like carrier [Thalassococcus profundi]RDD64700.1 quinoprotein dehydrogenase-associated SoxYZ-like carrier [Thalassococcus profundi]